MFMLKSTARANEEASRKMIIRLATERDDLRRILANSLEVRDAAMRRARHFEAEIAQLTRDIEGLLPDAEAHRARKARQMRNLRQFKGANGAAAQGGVA